MSDDPNKRQNEGSSGEAAQQSGQKPGQQA